MRRRCCIIAGWIVDAFRGSTGRIGEGIWRLGMIWMDRGDGLYTILMSSAGGDCEKSGVGYAKRSSSCDFCAVLFGRYGSMDESCDDPSFRSCPR